MSNEIPDTDITRAITLTWHVADLPPSSDLAVTVAVHGLVPMITPSETVTYELSEDQITVLFVALLGEIVAVIRVLSPSVNSTDVWLNVIPVTATVVGCFWQENNNGSAMNPIEKR